ncbi:MAG TPA: LamG domain-containing protein [Kofleriaceae bacterium]|nr:LamG domain-containing protein [Kofleriaceae bacterium]
MVPAVRWLGLAGAMALAGCQFEPDHQGTGYRCDSQHRCPDGTECIDMVCVGAGGDQDDAAAGTGDDASPRADGLVAYWPMDEANEGAALDATGRHEATCDNCPTLESGHQGGAWRFNGFSQFLRVEDDDALQLAEGTISVWARFEEMNWGALVGKPYGTEDHNSFLVFSDDTLTLRFEVNAGFVDGVEFDLDTWIHVVATWEASGGRELRVGGQTSSADDDIVAQYDDQDVLVAVDFDPPDFVSYFRGSLDELRIYDRVLTPAELDDL